MTTPDAPQPAPGHDPAGQPALFEVSSPGQPGPSGSDVLGDAVPAPAGTGGRRVRRGLVAVAALGVLGVSGAGVAAAVALSGGGSQPEDVVPANALAFARIDLDPSAGQKLDAYRLARKFPAAAEQLKGEDTLRDDVLRAALLDSGVDYDDEVKPWLGDRAGVAAVPTGGDEPGVLVALAFTDRDKAEQALRDAEQPVEFAVVEDYVLISDDRQLVEEAAAASEHLADEKSFTEAVGALDGDQIALAWADAGRVWAAVPQAARDDVQTQAALDGLSPAGQVVVGLQVESDAVEVRGRTVGFTTGLEDQDVLASRAGSGLAEQLPADAFAALSIAGLGESLTQGYAALSEGLGELAPDLEAQAGQFGLSLPEDLATVLGSETAVGVWGDDDAPEVLVRTRSDDPAAARDVLRRAYDATGGAQSGTPFEDLVQEREDGLAVGTSGAVAADGGTLADREEFAEAVPDAGDAGLVLWVAVQDALGIVGEPSEDTDPLEAFGLTADGADGGFRARLTFR